MKQIVTATAAFERMREKDVVYVDKTAYFYQLLQRDPDTVFFIARPRRFGKSLMINTLTSLLQGKRDLFRGLAIDQMDYDWGRHAVVRLRLTDACAATPEGVRAALQEVVRSAMIEQGVEHDPQIAAELNFKRLLEALPEKSETGRFAVLVDEYDAPLNAFIDEPSTF
ncbi:MAG: AAA family ATPase, partial [bacterium]|nr:AAA family ATPase [bacterium]